MQVAHLPALLKPVKKADPLRLGRIHDGGYVLSSRSIDASDTLLSFGLAQDWSFEEDFKRHKSGRNQDFVIHCYDHTTKIEQRPMKLLTRPKRRRLHQSYHRLFNNRNVIHFKERVWWNDQAGVSIPTIFSRTGSRKLLVKMDIEGAEYRVIDQILAHTARINALVIEFHDLDILTERFTGIVREFKSAFELTHIHANNYAELSREGFPPALELTFEKKSVVQDLATLDDTTYPDPLLDSPNNPQAEDYRLEFTG